MRHFARCNRLREKRREKEKAFNMLVKQFSKPWLQHLSNVALYSILIEIQPFEIQNTLFENWGLFDKLYQVINNYRNHYKRATLKFLKLNRLNSKLNTLLVPWIVNSGPNFNQNFYVKLSFYCKFTRDRYYFDNVTFRLLYTNFLIQTSANTYILQTNQTDDYSHFDKFPRLARARAKNLRRIKKIVVDRAGSILRQS